MLIVILGYIPELRTCERWDCALPYVPTDVNQKYHSPYCSNLALQRRRQRKKRERLSSMVVVEVGRFNAGEICARELAYRIREIGPF